MRRSSWVTPTGALNISRKQAMVPWVLAEFLVDEPHVRADQADGLRSHPAQFGMLLQQHEQLEERRGKAREYLRVRDFQIVVANLESRVDGNRRSALRQDGLAKTAATAFR